MKSLQYLWPLFVFIILSSEAKAQTNKDIQGTWRVVSTTIKNGNGQVVHAMDSTTHNLTKVITPARVMFTIYNKKSGALEVSGQGKATTNGNQYIETFEQSTADMLLIQPMAFTYKVNGNQLTYEGGPKDFHIVEVLQRIE